jgi:hypothetical protein
MATSNNQCVDHEAHCLQCKRGFSVFGYHYHALGKKRKVSPTELTPLTSPWLLQSSKTVRAAEERFRKLLTPFIDHDNLYRSRGLHIRMQVDWVGGLSFLFALATPFAVAILFLAGCVPSITKAQGVGIALIVSFVVIPWGIYMFMGENRRFFCRQLVPKIGEEIHELDPHPEEIDAAIRRLKLFKCPTASLLSKRRIRQVLDSSISRITKKALPGTAGEKLTPK